MKTTEQIGAVLSATGTHTLGALVFWSLSAVRIERAALRAALAELGMAEAMPKDPSPKAALSKAVPAIIGSRKGLIARRIPGGFGLLVERIEDGRRLDVTHVANVTTQDQEVLVEYLLEAGQIPEDEIRAEYEKVRTKVQTMDLSEVLTAALMGSPSKGLLGAISIRERTGGLYFVPGEQVARMQRLKATLETLAPLCTISVMTITGDRENLEQTASVARVTFSTQLATLRDELTEFQANLQVKGKTPNGYSISTRAEKYRELRDRVELFRAVLGDVATELQEQVDGAKQEMLKALGAE